MIGEDVLRQILSDACNGNRGEYQAQMIDANHGVYNERVGIPITYEFTRENRREQRKVNMEHIRKKRNENGLCFYCGKVSALPDRIGCAECLRKETLRKRKK